jgi:HlyD family secretion protein
VERGLSAQRSAEAQVADARSRQALAAAEATRYQDLLRQNFVSPSVVDGKQQALKSADAQLAAADAALAAARQDVARLGAEQQALGQQRANLRLLAPADGVVTAREAEPGSTVVAGQAVLRLQQPGSLWVTTRFDQARAAGLAEGLPAQIRLRSAPERALPGKVLRVEPVADSVTEERIAQIAFDTPPAGVSTKEMAEVTVALPVVPQARVLPNAALKVHQGRAGVWVLDGEHLRFAPVRTGARGPDGAVQILDGLPADARVVVYSERALAADTRVRVVEQLPGVAP